MAVGRVGREGVDRSAEFAFFCYGHSRAISRAFCGRVARGFEVGDFFFEQGVDVAVFVDRDAAECAAVFGDFGQRFAPCRRVDDDFGADSDIAVSVGVDRDAAGFGQGQRLFFFFERTGAAGGAQRFEGEDPRARPGSGAGVEGAVVRPSGAVDGDRGGGAVAKGEGGLGERVRHRPRIRRDFVGVVVEEEVPGGASLGAFGGQVPWVGGEVGTLGAEAEFFTFVGPSRVLRSFCALKAAFLLPVAEKSLSWSSAASATARW